MSARGKLRPDAIMRVVKAVLAYRDKEGQPLFKAKVPKPPPNANGSTEQRTVNVEINGQAMQVGITRAGYHIENGTRTFEAFANAMVADLGEGIQPMLRSFYEAVRHYPGVDNAAMTPPSEIDARYGDSEGSRTLDGAAIDRDPSTGRISARLVAWMPPERDRWADPILGAVTAEPGTEISRGRHLSLIADRLEALEAELAADDPGMVAELAERLLEAGLIGEIPEPGAFYQVVWNPAVESRLAELDALLPMGETAIVPEASNRKAEAQMEETGLQTWVSKLLP